MGVRSSDIAIKLKATVRDSERLYFPFLLVVTLADIAFSRLGCSLTQWILGAL